MRNIQTHRVGEGSDLNNLISVCANERDESGGSHIYRIEFRSDDVDDEGDRVEGVGYEIRFQKGPLKEVGHVNGVSDEALLAIVKDRLEGFQTGPFSCQENGLAIANIDIALEYLGERTKDRQARGVEGKSEA